MSDDAVTHSVREGDRDRYIATLLAPAAKREALMALHAFDIELSHVPWLARQQIAGELRLQWWREAVDGSEQYETAANPIAAALAAAAAAHDLPRELLHAMIDARQRELVPEPFSVAEDMTTWCDESTGSVLHCNCLILDPAPVRAGAVHDAIRNSGRAIGVVQLLMSFAIRASRGQSIVPAAILADKGAGASDVTAGRLHDGVVDALADMRELARENLVLARDSLRNVPSSLRPAFLLLGSVEPRLRWLERNARDPYVSGDVPRWRRILRMWRARV